MSCKEFELWLALSLIVNGLGFPVIKAKEISGEYFGLRELGKVSIELCGGEYSVTVVDTFKNYSMDVMARPTAEAKPVD